jgi:hypothetical protein
MRCATVWHCSVQDDEAGSVQFWATTKAGVLRLAREYVAEDADRRRVSLTQKHRIELSSAGFAGWLEVYFTHDNG